MATITENYVSFETAKLLKEKGFNEKLKYYYDSDEVLIQCNKGEYFDNKSNGAFIAPTLQMAMKWLREVHKLYINIWADPKDIENNDFTIIFRSQVYNGNTNYGIYDFSTYEEACETTIKYCLENLI